jgi:hypothetical protein
MEDRLGKTGKARMGGTSTFLGRGALTPGHLGPTALPRARAAGPHYILVRRRGTGSGTCAFENGQEVGHLQDQVVNARKAELSSRLLGVQDTVPGSDLDVVVVTYGDDLATLRFLL